MVLTLGQAGGAPEHTIQGAIKANRNERSDPRISGRLNGTSRNAVLKRKNMPRVGFAQKVFLG
jgi:hypothetical protein